ncbi:MAG TPA: DUF1801 domain-containing protein [Chitinophagaceae bacterium]
MQRMSKIAKDIDEYINGFSGDTKDRLSKIRTIIQKAAPKATEKISYAIPTFFYGGNLVHFAAYKNHIGFYPGAGGIEAFQKELGAYETSKGTVQFPHDKPLPAGLITQIVKFRVLQNKEKAEIKKPVKKAASAKAKKPTDDELVKAWMAVLSPAVRKEIEAVRKIIKAASDKLNERIKWNAPSYYYKEDILTFGPYKKDKILLVFHHPAVVKVKSGLLEGNFPGRRLLYLKNAGEAEKNKKELTRIIKEIITIIEKAK